MDSPAIAARVESLREEITIIRNQELFYQRRSRHSYEEIRAHARRELRLLDIQAALRRLLRDEPAPKTTIMRIRNSEAHHMTEDDRGPADNSVAQS
jgi:negative regulator of sigma E activity